MLDTVIQFIQSLLGPIGTLGRTILGVVAVTCIIFTGVSSINGFRSADMKKGGLYLAVTIIILIVSIIIYGAVRSIGKGTGNDINNSISMLPLLATIPVYAMHYKNKVAMKMNKAE